MPTSDESKPLGWKDKFEFCKKLPKCELHAHLNGSIRDSTIRELAKKLKETDPNLYAQVPKITDESNRNLQMCFQLFAIIHKLTADHDIITRITTEVIHDFAHENVRYLELRTTPKDNASMGMTKKSYMEAVFKGLELSSLLEPNEWNTVNENEKRKMDGVEKEKNDDEYVDLNSNNDKNNKLKTIVRFILSIDRRESAKSAMETVKLACLFKEKGVVGIDLSGNPSIGEWETFLPALTYAKANNLAITLHCGEVPNAEEVKKMLQFCPQRLGHVELCLTSNVLTNSVGSYHDHHFSQLYSEKHPFVICTDDCGVFNTTLSKEYAFLASAFCLTEEDLNQITMDSIPHIFADSRIQQILKSEFESCMHSPSK